MTAAPTQPPDKCPACGEPLLGIEDVIGLSVVRYECGRKLTRGVNADWTVYNSCPGAEAEAIALRAERDALGQDIAKLAQQRNAAFSEMHAIRSAIRANPKEATSDEVARVVAERDAALARAEKAEGLVSRTGEMVANAYHAMCGGHVQTEVVSKAIVQEWLNSLRATLEREVK